MKLVVGLGNPGSGYADTYHNLGFIALDELSARFNAPRFSGKDNAEVSEITSGSGERVMLCKPTTFMNLSGDAVGRIARFYKIPFENILVVYDDIDIKRGVVRYRPNGSCGTHNGMRDIVAKLGSSDFPRIRIGYGPRPEYMGLADFVLSHIPSADKPIFKRAAEIACDLACDFIDGKPIDKFTFNAECD